MRGRKAPACSLVVHGRNLDRLNAAIDSRREAAGCPLFGSRPAHVEAAPGRQSSTILSRETPHSSPRSSGVATWPER